MQVDVAGRYLASILADLCSHSDPLPISGMVYLTALPYVDSAMVARIATPTVLEYLTALVTPDDVALS